MANNNGPEKTIGAVENSLEILEEIVDAQGISLTELDNKLELSKSSIHNHLQTLESKEYVQKDREEYHTGLQCISLGGYARDNNKLFQIAKPVADTIAEETGELAIVTVPNEMESIYIYLAKGDDAVILDSYLGRQYPLHCTGSGKAMLAMMDDDYIESVISSELSEETENTITTEEELRKEINNIRDQGIAFDDEERIIGIRGVAVPIKHRTNGNVIGALAVTGPTSRIKGDLFREELPDLVRRNAEMIEVNYTHSQ